MTWQKIFADGLPAITNGSSYITKMLGDQGGGCGFIAPNNMRDTHELAAVRFLQHKMIPSAPESEK